ncbi:MAG: LapA family protein [Minwuia sp.]|nr:LapA family protein [Minwuia sp.]
MKLIRLLVLFVALVVCISLAISNRETVAVGLEPLPFVINIPMFAVIFGAMFVGVIVGGFSMWWRDGSVRQRARREHRHADELERDLKKTQDELDHARDLARAANDRKALRGPEAA